MDPHPHQINEGLKDRWRSDPMVIEQQKDEIARDFARPSSRLESLLVWSGLAAVVLAVATWALLTR